MEDEGIQTEVVKLDFAELLGVSQLAILSADEHVGRPELGRLLSKVGNGSETPF